MRFYIRTSNIKTEDNTYPSLRKEARHLSLLNIMQINKRISRIENAINGSNNVSKNNEIHNFALKILSKRLDYLRDKQNICKQILIMLDNNQIDNDENNKFVSLVMTYFDNDLMNF